MTTFEELGINNGISAGLTELGFTAPTAVQEQVIPAMLNGSSDIIALAQTGTGKTAAFGLPLIQLVESGKNAIQALVLCPTRELCRQVAADFHAFSQRGRRVKTAAIYGGAAMDAQIREIRRGVQVIVATPGRLNDLIRRKKVDLSGVNLLVFDEADEMLQMGFRDELDEILVHTPLEKKTCLFSATMSAEVRRIAENYMKTPIEITVGKRNTGTEHVRHEVYTVHSRHRYSALRSIIDFNPGIYSIIFCRTRRETAEISDKLIRDGYRADALHGELSQAQRDKVMNNFRKRHLQLLVATDVAARGLDVDDLTHVINYNLPDDIASYTHRSGRTGRAGKTGTSVAIVHAREQHRIKQIEKRLNRKFIRSRIPTGEEICRKQLLSRAEAAAENGAAFDMLEKLPEGMIDEIREKFSHMDRDELIMRLVAREAGKMLRHYSTLPDLNASQRDRIRRSDPKRQNRAERQGAARKESRKRTAKLRRGSGLTRFHINVGRRQGVEPGSIISRINEIPGSRRIRIEKIDIMRNTATVEADSRFTPQIISAFQDSSINGRKVTIQIARSRGEGHNAPSRPRKVKVRPAQISRRTR